MFLKVVIFIKKNYNKWPQNDKFITRKKSQVTDLSG
jgi:hypothetical protein